MMDDALKLAANIERNFSVGSSAIDYECAYEGLTDLLLLIEENWPVIVAEAMLFVLNQPSDDEAESVLYEILRRLNVESFDGRRRRDTGDKMYGIEKTIAKGWLCAADSMTGVQRQCFISFLRWSRDKMPFRADVETFNNAIDWWTQVDLQKSE